jgi:hypothetical protein
MAAKSQDASLEEIARAEAQMEKERQARIEEHAKGAHDLAKEVPERFFKLTGELRDAVRRFNEAADPQKRLTWRESAALAARDGNLSGDFSCGFSRNAVDVGIGLTEMSRSGGRPNCYIIEAVGTLRGERFMFRAEGMKTGGKLGWRMTVDMQRVNYSFDELADRLVRAAVTLSLNPLTSV